MTFDTIMAGSWPAMTESGLEGLGHDGVLGIT
jgi:hypothetical protein